jgi:hypothetical protein
MDCSTFSFDLHVLGAPPALILSRDQTLIVCCEFAKSPRLTQSTDEFFFTASNQIVKDLRSRPRNCERPEGLQASNLFQPQARIATPVASKLLNLKKNQTGRPFSAHSGGPEQVLLPFLTEDLYRLYHGHVLVTSTQSVRFLKIPNWRPVQNIRVFPHDARGFSKKEYPMTPRPLNGRSCL